MEEGYFISDGLIVVHNWPVKWYKYVDIYSNTIYLNKFINYIFLEGGDVYILKIYLRITRGEAWGWVWKKMDFTNVLRSNP